MSAPTAPRPWIVYVRVSTDEQAQQGASVGGQETACRSMLGVHGFGPIEVVVDDVSGKNLNRPGIGAVLRRIEAGEITGLCVYAIDRLTRRARDLDDLVELFEAKRIELISVRERVDTSGPMGRFVLRLIGSIAQLERETIASRVRMGMAHRKAQGGYLGRAPAGTVAIRGADNLRRLHPDPKTGPIVARLWPMLVEGRSLMDVAEYLHREGVRTSKGTRWSRTAVGWLAGAPSVVGVLVDEATWNKAQAAVTARHKRKRALEEAPAPSGRAQRDYPLAGLCFCAGCGSALVIGSGTGKGGRLYPYLKCSGRKRYGEGYCAAADLPYAPVEAAILDGLRLRFADGSVSESCNAWLAKRRASLEARRGRAGELRADRDKLARRLALVWEVVEEGGDSGRAARARAGEVQRELDRVDAELAALESAADIHARDEAAMARLLADAQEGAAAIASSSESDRRAYLAGLAERIVLSREAFDVVLAVPGASRFAQPASLVHQPVRRANTADGGDKPRVGGRLEWRRATAAGRQGGTILRGWRATVTASEHARRVEPGT